MEFHVCECSCYSAVSRDCLSLLCACGNFLKFVFGSVSRDHFSLFRFHSKKSLAGNLMGRKPQSLVTGNAGVLFDLIVADLAL